MFDSILVAVTVGASLIGAVITTWEIRRQMNDDLSEWEEDDRDDDF